MSAMCPDIQAPAQERSHSGAAPGARSSAACEMAYDFQYAWHHILQPVSHRKRGIILRAATRLLVILALVAILVAWPSAYALDAALDLNEYAHTAWTVR